MDRIEKVAKLLNRLSDLLPEDKELRKLIRNNGEDMNLIKEINVRLGKIKGTIT